MSGHCFAVLFSFCIIHYYRKKIQPLDITFNKPAKIFIKEKYNIWYTDTEQLNEDKDPADVEGSLNLSRVKPLHATWHFKMYKYLQGRNDLIINGFKAAGFNEAVEKSNIFFHRIENPFIAYRSEQD